MYYLIITGLFFSLFSQSVLAQSDKLNSDSKVQTSEMTAPLSYKSGTLVIKGKLMQVSALLFFPPVKSGCWILTVKDKREGYLLFNAWKYEKKDWFKENRCLKVTGEIPKDIKTVFPGTPLKIIKAKPILCK